MAINWETGTARLSRLSKWLYLAFTALMLPTMLLMSDRLINRIGAQETPRDELLRHVTIGIEWAVAFSALYFALKYLLRAVRWVLAGFSERSDAA